MRLSAFLLISTAFALPAVAGEASPKAIDSCVAQLRIAGGPDAQHATILSSQTFGNSTVVFFRDSSNAVWSCLAVDDGHVADLSMTQGAEPQNTFEMASPLSPSRPVSAWS